MYSLVEAMDLSVGRIGGKAVRLAELARLGYRVKPALILDVDEVSAIARGTFPFSSLHQALSSYSAPTFAVRSSADGEDGEHSWAGQFMTELFVIPTELIGAIQRCAQAVDGATVMAYAKLHHAPVPPLALIIQEMVPAVMSGVMFTCDPTHGAKQILIEMVSGVAEELVSGTRQPRRYRISRATGEVVSVEGAALPELSEVLLAELLQVADDLDRHFGCHQDIEWAVDADGRLFLNQCRNITVDAEGDEVTIETAAIARHRLHACLELESVRLKTLGAEIGEDVLTDQNVSEILTPHPCRMAFGLFTYVFAHDDGAIRVGRCQMGYEIGAELNDGFFRLVAGQPRCSIIHDAMTYRIQGIPLTDYMLIVREYLARIKGDLRCASYPEIGLYEQDPDVGFLEKIFGPEKAGVYLRCYEQFFLRFHEVGTHLLSTGLDPFTQSWRERIGLLSQMDGDDLSTLVAGYREVCDALRTDACVMFVTVARLAFFAYARLKRVLIRLYGAAQAEMFLPVLCSQADPSRNPNLRFSVALADLRDGRVTLEEVMEEFGHLAAHQMEISVPRYREQPEVVRQMAMGLEGDPLTDYARTANQGEELFLRLSAEATSDDRRELDFAVRAARAFLVAREAVKFEFLRGYELARRLALRIARTLNWEADLVFHLDPRDIFTLIGREHALQAQALEEQVTWRRHRLVFVPQAFFVNDLTVIGQAPLTETGDALHGVGVTNFITEGEVVVIHSLSDRRQLALLRPGSVLVTVTTDPAWTAAMSIIGRQGALVTEVGGVLAHAAIYAREVGFAAVLNVSGATHRLRTGMRVRVDGRAGTVHIL